MIRRFRFDFVHHSPKRVTALPEVSMLRNKGRILTAWLTLVVFAAAPWSITAQTQIKYHSNKFSVQDDVKLGRQAAQEAEQQFPLLNDETVRGYVESIGRRLVNAIPPQFQHPEFHYYFKVVNARSEEHTSELQSRGLISYAVFCL